MRKIGILAGAGLSQAAVGVGTKCITDRILLDNDYYYYNDHRPYWSKEAPSNKEFLSSSYLLKIKIQIFLKLVIEKLNQHSCSKPCCKGVYQPVVNYEELYYWIRQIKNTAQSVKYNVRIENDNPFCSSFVEELDHKLAPLLKHNYGYDITDTVQQLAAHAENYIFDIVWTTLKELLLPLNCNCFDFLKEAINDSAVCCKDIFTLNNDTLIEGYFNWLTPQISFCDGFTLNNGAFKWEPSLFVSTESVNLFKLHGSVNWIYQCEGDDWSYYEKHFSRTNFDKWKLPHEPVILVGTNNKILNYTYAIYADLLCAFHCRLNKLEALISFGYGFNDYGINMNIISWMYSNRAHKLFIIDILPEETFINNALENFKHSWKHWKKNGATNFITLPENDNLQWNNLKPLILP